MVGSWEMFLFFELVWAFETFSENLVFGKSPGWGLTGGVLDSHADPPLGPAPPS